MARCNLLQCMRNMLRVFYNKYLKGEKKMKLFGAILTLINQCVLVGLAIGVIISHDLSPLQLFYVCSLLTIVGNTFRLGD